MGVTMPVRSTTSVLPPRFPARVVGGTFTSGYPGTWYRTFVDRADLELRREADNPADPNAVAVMRADTGTVLGHLRRDVAARLAPELDDGALWIVVSYTPAVDDQAGAHPGLTIRIERISWADDPPLRPAEKRPTRPPAPCRIDPRVFAQRMDQQAAELAPDVIEIAPDLWAVPSASQPDRRYAVAVDIDDHRLVRCLCHCSSGTFRPQLPVPCRHAAAVIRHLAASGTVRIVDGLPYHLPAVAAPIVPSVPMDRS
jgi:hypothetical protein